MSVLPLLLAVLHAPSPAAKVEAELQGTWVYVGGEEKGLVLDAEAARKEDITCVIKSDRLTFFRGGREMDAYTFKLRPKGPLPEIDLTDTKNEGVNHAIYSLEGGRFRVCMSRKGNANTPEERPIRFTTKRDENKNLNGLLLFIFERKVVVGDPPKSK